MTSRDTTGAHTTGPDTSSPDTTGPNAKRRALARRGFQRSIIYLVIAGAAMVVAAMLYLASSGAMTGTLVFTVTAGVFVSVVLGGGLMAVGFYSSSSGYDEEVADLTTAHDDVAQPPIVVPAPVDRKHRPG